MVTCFFFSSLSASTKLLSYLNKHRSNKPTVLPNTIVVNITKDKDVVTITSLFLNFFPSILKTKPKAIAPRIIPAYQIKIS